MLTQRVRAPAATIVGAFLVLMGTEIVVRSAWFEHLPLVSTVFERKAAWLSEQEKPDVLILGDSTAHRGIDARRFGSARGAKVLNAAFTSESPILMRSVLRDASWRPSEIVVGMFPLLLSDDWSCEPHEASAARVGERVSLLGWGEGVLGSVWRTYNHRRTIAELAFVLVHRLVGVQPAVEPHRPKEDRWGSLAVDQEPELSEEAARNLLARWLRGTKPHLGVRAEALAQLAKEWQQKGIRVTYVWMPADSHLRSALAAKDLGTFQAESLREIAAITGSRVLDCQAAVPDDGFYDSDHLRAGPWRDRFSEELGRAVASGSTSCPSLQ